MQCQWYYQLRESGNSSLQLPKQLRVNQKRKKARQVPGLGETSEFRLPLNGLGDFRGDVDRVRILALYLMQT